MKIKVFPCLLFILFLSCDKGYFVSEDVVLASAYNDVLFKSEVYKGHEHDPVDFGKRLKSIILYMLES